MDNKTFRQSLTICFHNKSAPPAQHSAHKAPAASPAGLPRSRCFFSSQAPRSREIPIASRRRPLPLFNTTIQLHAAKRKTRGDNRDRKKPARPPPRPERKKPRPGQEKLRTERKMHRTDVKKNAHRAGNVQHGRLPSQTIKIAPTLKKNRPAGPATPGIPDLLVPMADISFAAIALTPRLTWRHSSGNRWFFRQ